MTEQRKRASARPPQQAEVGAPSPTTLILIDDNRLLREGLSALLHAQPGFQVLLASADADLTSHPADATIPDVVLIDFGLADHDSLQVTASVRTRFPGSRVIIMGLVPLQEDVASYVHAGASGFIMKDASADTFFETIRAVAVGAEILPPELTNTLFAQIARNAIGDDKVRALEAVRLTGRERQVIDLLGEGLSNKEIATRLQIAIHTVKSHVHNVLEKLALRSRLEVAAFTRPSVSRRPDQN